MTRYYEYEGIKYANKDDLPIPPNNWGNNHLKKWFCGMAALKVTIEYGGKISKQMMSQVDGPLYQELKPLLIEKFQADMEPRKGKPWSKWFDLADWATTYRAKEGRFSKNDGIWEITDQGLVYYQQYKDIYETRYSYLLGNITNLRDNRLFWNLPINIEISPQKRQVIEIQEQQEKNLRALTKNQQEREYVLALKQKEQGNMEVPIYDELGCIGIADLITATEIIEVKKIENWKHALGQIYSYWMPVKHLNLFPRIHLFGGDKNQNFRLKQARKTVKSLFKNFPCRVTYEP